MLDPSRIAATTFIFVVASLILIDGAHGQSRRPFQNFLIAPLAIETTGGIRQFTVEVAKTPGQLAQGLMFRRRLAADAGMLFIYPRAEIIVMWMQNTLIPLDMLFIDSSLRIVHIVQRTIPLSTKTINSLEPVLSVLELNAGTVSKLGIKLGDIVVSSAFGK